MNAITGFRLCTLSNEELLKKVDEGIDKMFRTGDIPSRHIPARPNSDLDLLVGELTLRFSEKTQWIDANKKTPQLIKDENYSENVLAVCNGQLSVMCYCYIPGEDGGYVWANCNEKIDGDAEFDENYEVTHWQSFPSLPKLEAVSV